VQELGLRMAQSDPIVSPPLLDASSATDHIVGDPLEIEILSAARAKLAPSGSSNGNGAPAGGDAYSSDNQGSSAQSLYTDTPQLESEDLFQVRTLSMRCGIMARATPCEAVQYRLFRIIHRSARLHTYTFRYA